MKKLLLLMLVLLGGVMQMSADDIVIYFSPNWDWSQGEDVSFKLNQTNDDESSWLQTDFVKYSDDVNHLYYATLNTSGSYTKFKIQKYEGSDYKNQFHDYVSNPSSSVYYIMYNGGYSDKDYYPYYTSTYLPCNYYLASDVTGSWKVDEKMEEKSSGIYTATIDRASYKDKYLTWAPGYSFLADGTISLIAEYRMVNGWDHVLRPSNIDNDNVTINFQNYSYDNTLKTGSGSVWVLSASEEGNVTVSYTPSSNSATISSTKEATIGAEGYITYSNGEKCTISGATAYRASVNNTSTVRLTEMDAATVWPENEGMILKGNNGTKVTINAVGSSTDASSIGTNFLVGTGNSAKNVTVGNTNNTIYIFAKDDTEGVGFFKASASGELAAHKAYLDLSKNGGSGSRDFLGLSFDDETTGINALDNLTNSQLDNNTPMYNLAGQRVGKNYKGVVIQNGKKMLMK